MVDTVETINQFSDSYLTYEGYLTILSGDSPNQKYTRLDQLMELDIDTVADYVTHYSSRKKKHNVLTGTSSIGIISLKDTVDLYEKSSETNLKEYLMTFIVSEIENNLTLPPLKFVGIQKTLATSDPTFIIENIECDAIAFRKRRNLDTGDHTDVLEVSITQRTPNAEDSSPEP